MKHIFIINPAAGKYDHSQQFRKQIEEACGARGLAYEICVSQKPGDCRDIARKAAESGEEVRLYACGGDGTLNEVVNGVVGFPNAAITHFPGGSGNDAIKIFSETEPFFQLERLLDADEAAVSAAVERSGIPPHQKVHDLTREQRRELVQSLKHFSVEIAGPCPVTDAIVTSGGIKISEIAPKTMESKLVKGLYFSGEIMDVDAYTGGFNLQIAWATGRAAGQAAAEALRQGEENA